MCFLIATLISSTDEVTGKARPRAVNAARATDSLYLDLEHPADLDKLADPRSYLGAQTGRLIVLDEVYPPNRGSSALNIHPSEEHGSHPRCYDLASLTLVPFCPGFTERTQGHGNHQAREEHSDKTD